MRTLTSHAFTARINLDHKISDQIKVGVSATGSYIDNGNVQLGGTNQTSGVLMSALQMSPLAPVRNDNGDYYINPLNATLPNPVSFREIMTTVPFKNVFWRMDTLSILR